MPDVFISYGHIDDKPLVTGYQGWVTVFEEYLRNRLSQLLGRDAEVWLDRRRLQGHHLFDKVIMTTATQSVDSPLGSHAPAESLQPPQLVRPFPGLRPFGPAEAHLFFGRELHVEALLAKLASRRLVAVVGNSGGGKSSLVFAGALPRLRRGYRASTGSWWRVAHLRPGDDPIAALAAALFRAREEPDEQERPEDTGTRTYTRDPTVPVESRLLQCSRFCAQLRRSQLGLIEAARELNLDQGENLLVLVDQFEELFRFRRLRQQLTPQSDAATAFVQLLLQATSQHEIPIYVLLTMRSDFLGECVQFPGLAESVNEGQYLLPVLNRDERERVIRGPLGVAGAGIESTLVQQLLNDAGDRDNQLPVLQHALMRTFDLWQDDAQRGTELTLLHYEASGGMSQALSKHADEAYAEVKNELGSKGERIAERLFRSLTERGEHGLGVRRPCKVSELLVVTDVDLPTLSLVVNRFVGHERGFLVVTPEGALTPDSLVDISHESLMRVWNRLRTWSEAEIAFGRKLRELQEAQQKYREQEAGLWGDPELSLSLKWRDSESPTLAAAQRYGVDLNAVNGFLDECVAARQQKRDVATRKAELERRSARRFRIAAIALALLAAIALAAAVWAIRARQAAVRSQLKAERSQLEAEMSRQQSEQDKKIAAAAQKAAEEAQARAERAEDDQRELALKYNELLRDYKDTVVRTDAGGTKAGGPKAAQIELEDQQLALDTVRKTVADEKNSSTPGKALTAYSLWKQGYDAFGKGDKAKAKELYQQAINADPSYAPAYNSIGRSYAESGNIVEAQKWYREAIKRAPTYAPAHYNWALLGYEVGNLPGACTGCKKALEYRKGYEPALQLMKKITGRGFECTP